jgi:dienelactone hydrolase
MTHYVLRGWLLLAWVGLVAGCAQTRPVTLERLRENRVLLEPPVAEPAAGFAAKAEGVRAIYYRGLPYRGKGTKVFAFIGVPAHKLGERLPAMVLLHGGGGTAFEDWVRMWNDRGYVAIAPDLCGSVPRRVEGTKQWQRHADAGPAGWDEAFAQVNEPMEDQWPYHAVADAMIAASLLKAMPEVDPDRIGLTGISWGGYLTCMVAAVDRRLKFAVPVYGCGYLDECAWKPILEKMGVADREKWTAWWDPKGWLPSVRCPVLWLDSTNDWAYPMGPLVKSMGLPKGEAWYCTTPRMIHNHPAGQTPAVIYAFADQFLKNGKPLPRVVGDRVDGEVVAASLWYTSDSGDWSKRKWVELPADVKGGRLTGRLPGAATAWFWRVKSADAIEMSGKPVIIDAAGTK